MDWNVRRRKESCLINSRAVCLLVALLYRIGEGGGGVWIEIDRGRRPYAQGTLAARRRALTRWLRARSSARARDAPSSVG